VPLGLLRRNRWQLDRTAGRHSWFTPQGPPGATRPGQSGLEEGGSAVHTYYLAVTIGMQAPKAADEGPVGDGVVVETHDPITTRNGLAEAINAVGRLLKTDPAMIVILHHFELDDAADLTAAIETQLASNLQLVEQIERAIADPSSRVQRGRPDRDISPELWREQALTNDQVMAVRSLLQKAYGYRSGAPLAPDETRWVEMLPVWLRNAIVSEVA
jgi:hypothetical protein